jgi:shikimate kinase
MKAAANNIVFIGFMGAGKSTLAKMLAKELKSVALDTDKIIENMESKKIKDIFEDKGEEYFRELEKKVALWLERSVQNSVVSTGGGFIHVENLNKIGKVIYLKSTYEGIIKRIKAHPQAKKKIGKRPLLQDTKKAKELFEKRESLYEKKADFIIDIEKFKDGKEILKEVMRVV